ncbi:hypothetical protein [Natrononativus amylolyticus]|uniref:hypothetical protein n=1 Tax=Natrononativus amylolyticus TaxID=2963434 RepID=UPI0020CF02A5|nr:hypothetical protein [Natrononativus amylolyticus]
MPSSTRRVDAREYATLAGGLLVALTVALRRLVFASYGVSPAPIVELWVLAGAFFLAAVPAYALVRYHLVTPLAVTIGLYVVTVFATYAYVLEAGRVSAPAGAAPLLVDLYLWIWFVPLALALAGGGLEYLLRRLFGRHSFVAGSDS